jgi:hypothetical protein
MACRRRGWLSIDRQSLSCYNYAISVLSSDGVSSDDVSSAEYSLNFLTSRLLLAVKFAE